jgi:hypothetical protein
MAVPTMLASASGELKQRRVPNREDKLFVAVKTPPFPSSTS